jgi:hypothetical protein
MLTTSKASAVCRIERGGARPAHIHHPCIPAGVIGMQVGAEHDIDLFRLRTPLQDGRYIDARIIRSQEDNNDPHMYAFADVISFRPRMQARRSVVRTT